MMPSHILTQALENIFYFDPKYYVKKNCLGIAIEDAKEHFLIVGVQNNYSPSPYFSPEDYYKYNPDVADVGISAFEHFVNEGAKEVRRVSKYFWSHFGQISARDNSVYDLFLQSGLFDPDWYISTYIEVGEQHQDPLQHFWNEGAAKFYSPSLLFDTKYYCSQVEVDGHIGDWNPLLHYLLVGTLFDKSPHPLLDVGWYKSKYPIEKGELSTLSHYISVGIPNLFDPNDLFDSRGYVEAVPEAARLRYGPLGHYLVTVYREGISPSSGFDTAFYLTRYPDVAKSGINPLVHYLTFGRAEGRLPKDTKTLPAPKLLAGLNDTLPDEVTKALEDPFFFDPSYYRARYGVVGSDSSVLLDFIRHPQRAASPYFDAEWYTETYRDVEARGFSALYHYLTIGRDEERKPSPYFDGKTITMPNEEVISLIQESGLFDESWYLYRHKDIAAAGVDPLLHYAKAGHKELSRTPNVLFDPGWYSTQAPDVQAYGWNPLAHYILIGSSKSLSPHVLFDVSWVETFAPEGRPYVTPLGLAMSKQKEGVDPNAFFDSLYYLAKEPDAAEFPGGAIGHFLEIGWKRGTDPSENFCVSAYLAANPDVTQHKVNPFVHFISSGRVEGRNPKPPLTRGTQVERFGEAEYGGRGPVIHFDSDCDLPASFSLSIAVHLHLYYPEMAEEFRSYFRNIPAPFDLFVSVPPGRGDIEHIKAIFQNDLPFCRSVTIRSPINRGRDIAPLLVEFGRDLLRYDIVLHLHSKRSPHSPVHADWRRFLLHYVLGNRAVVTQILTAFYADTTLGVFQPPYHPQIQAQPKWGANSERAAQLLLRMGLSYLKDHCPDFPAGSFFWTRTDAIRPLLDGRIGMEDFEEEGSQIDGTTAHAIERLFGIVPPLRGYTNYCRHIDIAHNLKNYYGKSRPCDHFDVDRSSDIATYRNLVQTRGAKRGRIAVVTAIIGPFDALLLPQQLEGDVDYFCVSDTINDGYGVFRIVQPTYFDADPRRTARYVKTNLLRLFPGYDYIAWVDANVLLRGKVTDFVAATEASGKKVGAIAHPLRQSFREEAEVAISMALDDANLIAEQLRIYEAVEGLEEAGLIESNFLVLNARSDAVKAFMQIWWNEINTYSRRDQLSINYALVKAGLAWHPLLDDFLSTRDDDRFCLFRHGLNEWGPKPGIYFSWYTPGSQRGHLLPLPSDHKVTRKAGVLDVDVVVCVYNALDDVRMCLDSVVAALDGRGRIIIVDDASDEVTARFLDEFAQKPRVTLVRQAERGGYTKAANAGIRASSAGNVLLLNSDTIVPRRAIDKLVGALQEHPLLGIVGPLSNAASWQSVPSVDGRGSQTAINEVPPGMTPEDLDLFFERQWANDVVVTPLVHGFCYCVKRQVFDTIGLFDEENFPRGYGEENDFSFRAADAGFDIGVLTSVYVFHSKSKSYADSERTQYMSDGMASLIRKATKGRIQRAVETMRHQPSLLAVREAAAKLFDKPQEVSADVASLKRRLFLLPSRRVDGIPAGSGYVRVVLPYQNSEIGRVWDIHVLCTGELPPLMATDTVVIQRDAPGVQTERLGALIETIGEVGARLVYEIDDDLLDTTALIKRGFQGNTSDLVERVTKLSKAAQCVTVSSRALEAKFRLLNDNVVFLPNVLDAKLWRLDPENPRRCLPDKETGQKITIGYIGTPSHDEDLALLTRVFEALEKRHPGRFDVVVIGGFSGPAKFGTKIPLPHVNDFPNFTHWLYQNVYWDIGVIPLADNHFNVSKSYLKYLEYAALGMAIVASNGIEYASVIRNHETGILVTNDKDSWVHALSSLIEHPEERARLALNAYADICENHTLGNVKALILKVLSGE